jgi:hypothetical protein
MEKSRLQTILEELSPESIQTMDYDPVDKAYAKYQTSVDRVSSWDEFVSILDGCYQHLERELGSISRLTTSSIDIIASAYRHKDPNAKYIERNDVYYAMALDDAKNGKIKDILKIISDFFKANRQDVHTDYVLGRIYEWDQKVELVTELFSIWGDRMPNFIDKSTPMAYADGYRWLIMQYLSDKRVLDEKAVAEKASNP